MAFSIVLVVGAGLFVRALQRATEIDPGFDPRGVELAALDLSLAGYTADTGRVFARQLIQRVRELPGVQSAALAAMVPLGGGGLGLGGLAVPGVQPPDGRALLRRRLERRDARLFRGHEDDARVGTRFHRRRPRRHAAAS